MNKKIFTLVVLFLTTTFMASAQLDAGTPVDKLPAGNSGDLYQLSAKIKGAGNDLVLSMGPNGELLLDELTSTSLNFGASLWCVNVEGEDGGKSANYDFTNKAMSRNIVVNIADTACLTNQDSLNVSAGYLGGWGFSNAFETTLGQSLPMYTHFKQDSILVLSAVAATAPATGFVVGVKAYGANQLAALQTTPADSVLYFTVWTPAAKVLTAKEFNTMLDTTKYDGVNAVKPGDGKLSTQLTFLPEKTEGENVFSKTKLEAVPSDSVGYVFLRVAGTKNFVFVDTNYVNTTGTRYLGFATGDTTDVSNNLTSANGSFINQFLFQLRYHVSNDSMAIQANAARFNLLDQAGKDHNTYDAGNNYAKDRYTLAPVNASTSAASADSLTVKLQDLTADLKRITLGISPANTKIKLGFSGCEAANDATTVPEDLYLIKNKAGQYLVMPIYNDTTATYPIWVTLEKNVDPMQQPGYQWFVIHTRATAASPINIYNREFTSDVAKVENKQLTTLAKGVNIAGAYVGATVGTDFIPVTAAARADEYLGYKMIAEETAKVTLYEFKYLHDFNMSTYLTLTDEDSIVHVSDKAKSPFRLTPLNKEKFGRVFTEKVKSAVQLYRMSYHLTVEDSQNDHNGKSVVADAENRYAVSEYYNVNRGDTAAALFYLKTNNTLDDTKEDYHALVDRAYWYTNPSTGWVKGGVDDNTLTLKVQNYKETRTSAFLVSPIETPLYRRFNTALENQEGSDAPLTLEFVRMNNPADKLYEDAWSKYSTVNGDAKEPSMGINFLGVKNSIQFPATSDFSYSIYVDTAFVRRPAAAGALDHTPKPQYMLAVGAEIVPPGKLCPYEPLHNTQAWRDEFNAGLPCAHAIESEGYTFGRYLINAEDSIGKAKGAYIWDNKWTRLAFVEAIHKGDSLYILDGVYNKTNADFAKMIADATYAKNNIVALDNNLHKDVVFQFRLIDLEDEAKNFYIESENENKNDNANNTHTTTTAGTMIAPMTGGWVKVHNGVPVISRGNALVAMADAERFNVAVTDEKPVANEEISAADVVEVIAVNGAVVVKNAAGKTVAISNILGKTLANTVITSDEATIAVPAGIVVVAVEGEDAVKVVVR